MLLPNAGDYGPEAWLLKYRVVREALWGDYYRTRPLRPSYTQLYPPEKHQPRTLIEVRYPEDDKAETLLQLLQRNDPQMEKIRTSDKKIAQAVERIETGKASDARLEGATSFLETALAALAGDKQFFLSVYEEQRGLNWVVRRQGKSKKEKGWRLEERREQKEEAVKAGLEVGRGRSGEANW